MRGCRQIVDVPGTAAALHTRTNEPLHPYVVCATYLVDLGAARTIGGLPLAGKREGLAQIVLQHAAPGIGTKVQHAICTHALVTLQNEFSLSGLSFCGGLAWSTCIF